MKTHHNFMKIYEEGHSNKSCLPNLCDIILAIIIEIIVILLFLK